MKQLRINMLGELSLQAGENRISSRDNRARKVWLLLAYLLCRKDGTVSPEELIQRIWGENADNDNPESALKVTMHRARTLLDKLWPNAGHELILRRGSGYCWNTDVPMVLDSEEFEQLCTADGRTLDDRLRALNLYQGEFIGKLSSAAWAIPIATHYHNLYIQVLLTVLPELEEKREYRQLVSLCRAAIPVEPYNETLYQHLMRSLMGLGEQKAAAAAYEEIRARLFHDFGITPCEQTRAVYRTVVHGAGDKAMPIETVLEHLLEQEPNTGALLCEFDCFKVLCHVEARAMIRSGNATHVALLSVAGRGDLVLSKRSLDKAMNDLATQIRGNLRRGDAFSRCSPSQYVILLPRANYENSCVVCRRVISAYERQHPHSPARIHFLVQPLSAEPQQIR